MTIGENIRAYRLKRKLSQQALAQLAGVHRQSIANYESGFYNPLPLSKQKIADALCITLDMLEKGPNNDEDMSDLARDIIDSVREMLALYERESRR